MIEAGEVEGPPTTPVPSTVAAVGAVEASVPPVPSSVLAELVDEATGTDMVAELDAMEADLAALDELLADEAFEGMEP